MSLSSYIPHLSLSRRAVMLLSLVVLFGQSPIATGSEEGEKLFALHVKPLFAEKCLACHGADPDDIQGGLDLRELAGLKVGGDSFGEDVLVLGKSSESYLYKTITRSEEGYEMPPKEADQLSEEERWWIRDWIDAGAPWPDEARVNEIQAKFAEGEAVTTSAALSQQWQKRRYEPAKLWAYRPLAKVVVPADAHPIDFLVDKKLDELGIEPSPSASAIEFLRRISFGLTGLPPDADDIEEFKATFAKDPQLAVKKYADKLLGSPHYGEHFALRWLDVVRYADSAGFANDYSRPNAWRYRDYVVRAFQNDKPYDQFVREQIAGDEIDPDDPEKVIATGFLRMGPWEQTSMSVFKETRQQWLDDVTDSVGQTFLAHAMQCAKCHDHKFDPVPTRDYYSMMAVFSTTQLTERDAEFLEVENQSRFTESDAWVNSKIAAYDEQRKALQAKVASARKSETGDAKVGNNGLNPGDEASLARMTKNIARHKWELDRSRPIALGVYTGKTIVRKNVGGRIALPANPWGKGEIEKDAILAGGSAYSPTDAVKPGALSAAESLGGMPQISFPAGKGARRTALADWITHPQNPLTSRVIVNRVWAWHFGQGIAGNPNNFGGTGALPTHPELLDYLASWFMQNGWSVKKLNRLIVCSETYRRSARHPNPAELASRDPAGLFYATFNERRLSAEEFRDSMLVVSGQLNREVGGIPARPDINLEVAFQPRQIMGGAASVYEPDPKPEQRNRRSIYTEKIRGVRDPFLEIFNQPGPDKSCELRETSTVAPQALTLLNSHEVNDRAIGFADRLVSLGLNKSDTIDRAFEMAFCRAPSDRERKLCLEHWEAAQLEEEQQNPPVIEYSATIRRTVMAEKTGEPYEFEEYMPAYQEYVPDLSAADVDAETRALAHVCKVLFNSNEFAYVD